MKTTRRPRHPVSRTTVRVFTPFLRYSATRDAYVMRGVGRHRGPVLVIKPQGVDDPADKTS